MYKLPTHFLSKVGSAKWVLIDQIWVSGLNFATGILLARFLGIEGYGKFVLYYSVLLYANTLQQALIIAPMLSIAPQLNNIKRTNYLGGVLSLQFALSLSLSIVIFLVGNVLDYFSQSWNFTSEIFPISLSIFFFQLQDWLRRYYFISSKSLSAFLNDFISYGGQVVALAFLCKMQILSISWAFWVIALTSAIAFVIGIIAERLYPLKQQTLQALQQSWKSGINLLMAGQINWLGTQGVLVLSGLILGSEALGGIRAAQNITGPFNILFQGMENFVPIKASQKYAEGRLRALIYFLAKVSIIGTAILSILFVSISFFSEKLMIIAYGQDYSSYSNLIVWQLFICVVAFLCIQGFYFFRTIAETYQILLGSIVSASMSIVSTMILSQTLQSVGIMLAILIGQLGYIFYFGIIIFRRVKAAY